ncbi:uncharacterized protein L969DRAFT_484083 [Mixia osmundae IAM 14324]|uniref:AA1-like domain-containing protein n=1 Tax=Mixia osmundae (strain CBS 9802 / IAM 14324 / JCM 22182 / KY 12970) TaxID=764103 RepID=G7E1A3_MIXOS|nr:uncharacterized protein L969DRAFT_484083 [Mixia osmundae IAM 14324]KEI38749.1 hypothetical protein L969DRAFT_484083 [Mixia osmundae IAM 14324]GAA96613.1 hypothetical protein E5Q_03283 [Mixia osmundae IAM 14324]
MRTKFVTMIGVLALVYSVAAVAVQKAQYAVQPVQLCSLTFGLIGGRADSFLFQLEHFGPEDSPFSATTLTKRSLACQPASPQYTRGGSDATECLYFVSTPDGSIHSKIDIVFRIDGKYLNYELLPSLADDKGLAFWSLKCGSHLIEERKS